jgi:predicted DNA-binding transcriptional regulator AlpA
MNAPIKKKLLSVREVAQLLGVSERYIYNRVHLKAERKFPIKPKRIGRLIPQKPSLSVKLTKEVRYGKSKKTKNQKADAGYPNEKL